MKKLTAKELKLLRKVLESIELDVLDSYRNVSGSFAEANMFDYDEEVIDIELKFGIEGDNEYTEQYQVDRGTMKIID